MGHTVYVCLVASLVFCLTQAAFRNVVLITVDDLRPQLGAYDMQVIVRIHTDPYIAMQLLIQKHRHSHQTSIGWRLKRRCSGMLTAKWRCVLHLATASCLDEDQIRPRCVLE